MRLTVPPHLLTSLLSITHPLLPLTITSLLFIFTSLPPLPLTFLGLSLLLFLFSRVVLRRMTLLTLPTSPPRPITSLLFIVLLSFPQSSFWWMTLMSRLTIPLLVRCLLSPTPLVLSLFLFLHIFSPLSTLTVALCLLLLPLLLPPQLQRTPHHLFSFVLSFLPFITRL